MDGKYEFVSPEWDIISDSAKDLVSMCIYINTCTCICAVIYIEPLQDWAACHMYMYVHYNVYV